MKILRVAAMAVLLPSSTIVFAGPLYGTVRSANTPSPGIEITVACPSLARPARPPTVAVTDQRGSFSMRVPTNGRCEMRLRRGNQLGMPFEVFLSDNPLRFDLDVDGSLNRMRP